MDTHKLRVFLEAVKTGSLNKTAESLGYTQPAIVHTMNSLEKDIGIKLVERTNRGVILSPAGKELMPLILELLEADQRLSEKINSLNESTRHRLTIAALPSVAQRMLSRPISTFQKQYPDCKIDLHLSNAPARTLAKEDRNIDLIITDIRFCRDLPHRVILAEPMYALVPENWDVARKESISVEELFQYKILLPLEKAMSSATLFVKEKAPDTMIISTITADILVSLVEQEMGVTVISQMSSRHLPPGVRLIPIKPRLERTLCVCVKDFDHLSKLQKDFLSILYEHLINFAANN